MTTRSTVRKSNTWRRPAAAVGALAMLVALWSGEAAATACTDGNVPVPLCYQQTDTGSLKGDKSEYMAVYCPSSNPYWREGWSDSWSSGWHIITPNPIGDSGVSKADFLLSNTSVHTNHWSITIGCSPINPSGNCTNPSTSPVSDPGCPTASSRSVCDGNEDCWTDWNEICTTSSGVTNYFCSNPFGVTQCWGCGSSSASK